MREKTIGIAALCAAIVILGAAATLPLVATAIGVFEIVALSAGNGDPTWNDDDLGAAALTAVVLLCLLAFSGGIGYALATICKLRAGRTVLLSILSTLAIAAIGCVLVTTVWR